MDLVESDRVDPGARDHGVLRGGGRKIQCAVQERGQVGGQLPRGEGHGDDVLEIACGRRLLDVMHRFDSHRAQQHVRRLVHEPDQPSEQPQIPTGGYRHAPGNRLGNRDREVLRKQFAEQHLDERAEDQGDRRPHGDTDSAGNAGAAQQLGQTCADQRLGQIARQKAGHGDTQLGARQHERGPPGHVERTSGGHITRLGVSRQAGPVHGRVGELLGDKIRGERGDQQDHQDAEADIGQRHQHAPTAGQNSLLQSIRGGTGLRGARAALLIAPSVAPKAVFQRQYPGHWRGNFFAKHPIGQLAIKAFQIGFGAKYPSGREDRRPRRGNCHGLQAHRHRPGSLAGRPRHTWSPLSAPVQSSTKANCSNALSTSHQRNQRPPNPGCRNGGSPEPHQSTGTNNFSIG